MEIKQAARRLDKWFRSTERGKAVYNAVTDAVSTGKSINEPSTAKRLLESQRRVSSYDPLAVKELLIKGDFPRTAATGPTRNSVQALQKRMQTGQKSNTVYSMSDSPLFGPPRKVLQYESEFNTPQRAGIFRRDSQHVLNPKQYYAAKNIDDTWLTTNPTVQLTPKGLSSTTKDIEAYRNISTTGKIDNRRISTRELEGYTDLKEYAAEKNLKLPKKLIALSKEKLDGPNPHRHIITALDQRYTPSYIQKSLKEYGAKPVGTLPKGSIRAARDMYEPILKDIRRTPELSLVRTKSENAYRPWSNTVAVARRPKFLKSDTKPLAGLTHEFGHANNVLNANPITRRHEIDRMVNNIGATSERVPLNVKAEEILASRKALGMVNKLNIPEAAKRAVDKDLIKSYKSYSPKSKLKTFRNKTRELE